MSHVDNDLQTLRRLVKSEGGVDPFELVKMYEGGFAPLLAARAAYEVHDTWQQVIGNFDGEKDLSPSSAEFQDDIREAANRAEAMFDLHWDLLTRMVAREAGVPELPEVCECEACTQRDRMRKAGSN